MKKLDDKEACIIKIDLTDMDSEMRSPKVKSLLQSGFQIVSSIPVSEEGVPKLLLILEKRTELHKHGNLILFAYILIIAYAFLRIYEVLN